VIRVDSYTIYHSSNAYLGSILAERALAEPAQGREQIVTPLDFIENDEALQRLERGGWIFQSSEVRGPL
jgi:hypothetical protein